MALARRGEVWVVDFNPRFGAEPGKIRPAVVIQADWLTEIPADTLCILPLTTQVRSAFEPLHISLPARDRLLRPSQIVVEKIRSVDGGRLREGPLTLLTALELDRVERVLEAVLGLAPAPR